MSKLYILTENKDTYRRTAHKQPRIVLWFGAVSPDYYLCFGADLDDALDALIDHLADTCPGYIESERQAYDQCVCETVAELKAENPDLDDDDAHDLAFDRQDGFTFGGNCSDIIGSDDWGIWGENVSRQDLLDLVRDLEALDYSGTPTVVVV